MKLRSFASTLCFAVGLSLLATGCATVKTSIQTPAGPLAPDKHSYSWVADPTGTADAPGLDAAFLHAVITAAVEEELSAKGWTHKPSGSPDLSLDYTIRITPQQRKERATDDNYVSSLRWSPGKGWECCPSGMDETVLLYEVGTLAIRMNDPAGKTVWLGSASVELLDETNPRRSKRMLRKAVHELLKDL